MTKQKWLALGVYRIFWKAGGYSVASVGHTDEGTNWFAPSNWTSEKNEHHAIVSTDWKMVLRVELIEETPYNQDLIESWCFKKLKGQMQCKSLCDNCFDLFKKLNQTLGKTDSAE